MMNRPPSIVGSIHVNTSAKKSEVASPTNHVYVSRNLSREGGITGKWVIDPTVRLPRSFMAFSAQQKQQNNAELSIKHAVTMDVDIFVLPTEPASRSTLFWKTKPRSVRIHTSSGNGSKVFLRIHDYKPSDDGGENLVRRPLKIHYLNSDKGMTVGGTSSIEIHLPVSFRGIAKIQVETITVSETVEKKSSIVSDDAKIIHRLIGDVSASDLRNPSNLDELEVEGNRLDKLTLKFDVE